mmetsp:Transcript_23650/g.21014  ORF Transcript_23650/g.21014 Transcript_23650/m.21014 type:complete len:216 (+) Transcript_23650:14-661(+)
MGSSGSKRKINEVLEEEYNEVGLPKISASAISNELEKEIYIAINMLRYDPKRMAKLMKPLKEMELMSKEARKSVDKVKKLLKTMETSPPLAYYDDGTSACKQVSNQFFTDEEEFKADPDKVITEAKDSLIPTLEESKKGTMTVKGDGRIITGINEETGALVILADICEWIGSKKSGVPPYLERINKKVGIHCYPITEENQACVMVFIEDFTNSMI